LASAFGEGQMLAQPVAKISLVLYKPEHVQFSQNRIKETCSPHASDASRRRFRPMTARPRDVRWVTRPRPHVDRLACIWLIRRFINPSAVIRYATTPEPNEVAFGMRQGTFGHRGNLCTFETMVAAFGLDDQSLHTIGEIVHEIDLRDGRYAHSETAAIDAVLKGWLLMGFSDQELEVHGVALFEGLYAAFARRGRRSGRGSTPTPASEGEHT
jgi:hypothetical protein